jgi:uncharacterized protein
MKQVVAILSLALGLALQAHAGIDEGVQAYISGEYGKAMSEFQPLAEGGNPNAQYYMGFMNHHGYGVKRNEVEAAKWFLYEKGVGIQQDLAAAHMWLSLAAVNPGTTFRDSLHTKEAVSKLERKMKPEQIAHAKEMAQNWKPPKN